MNNKKVLALVGVIVVVIIAIIVFAFMSKDEEVGVAPPPPATNNTNTPAQTLSENWEVYQSDAGKYGIALPKAWFIDQDSLIAGAAGLVVSNKEVLDENEPGIVAVEVYPKLTKKSGETLFAAIKAKGKQGGSYGETKGGATATGYEFFAVEHAFGSPTDGPGFAIARSKTEYMFITATSSQEAEIVDGIVNSVVFLK